MKKSVFLAVFILQLTISVFAQDRGLQIRVAEDFGPQIQIGRQWAVFIAIDRYREWPPLSNPVKDARELRGILTENYFIDEVRELYNTDATAGNIRRLFADLRQSVQINDSVFLFYAGHGHTDDLTQTGSWIPTDGGRDDMSQTNWLPNIQIRNMLSALPAKHVFLIADACFSGDILDMSRGAAPEISSEYYRRAYSRVSRQVMTSGASETVPDASEFAMRLKSSLLRAESSYVDPEYLFANVREVRQTQPLMGIIRGSEHQDGGTFLFFRKAPGPIVAGNAGSAVTPLPSGDGRVNPNAPIPASARSELSLDGKKFMSFYAGPVANASTFQGKGGGLDLSFSFYEKYGNYGEFFYFPNSYYVSAELFKDFRSLKSTMDQDVPDKGRQDISGVVAGLGTFWKIRLDRGQRFIAGFGLSLEIFLSNYALYTEDLGTDKKISGGGFSVNPGFGLSGGIGFRFNPLVSLDLGLSFKMGLIGKDLEVSGYDQYGYPYSGAFAEKVHPMTFGGTLGARFWFDR